MLSLFTSPPHRLIPAHAGKTALGACRSTPTRAHPRSRGENGPDAHFTAFGSGSSPLTRGKRREVGHGDAARGLIPAHAGKTGSARVTSFPIQAHPRSRGENEYVTWLRAAQAGSSPLTRGKPVELIGGGDERGLIPAHAGKTLGMRTPASSRWAHPRSRGENTVSVLSVCRGAGSSPLTRGKPFRRYCHCCLLWLIPAHAGKTSHLRELRGCRVAHPRSRGENLMYQVTPATMRGSSPLTRGKRPVSGSSSTCAVAHPRSRGENHSPFSAPASAAGSSPLTRGKRQRCPTRRAC